MITPAPVFTQTPQGLQEMGTLDFQHSLQVRELGLQWLKTAQLRVVEVDLSQVVLDSAGVAVCVSWWREAVLHQKQIVWKHVPASVNALAKAYGVATIVGLEG